MSYELNFHPDALDEWRKLDKSVREQFRKKLRLIESYTNLTKLVPNRPMETYRYLYVYRDYESPYNAYFNNGYYESGWLGDYDDVSVEMNETVVKHSGTYAMRWHYSGQETQGQKWAGVYWQAPAYFWGDRIGGYNLTGATRLTFWACGEFGGEKVRFMVGGINGLYNDSLQPARKSPVLSLTTTWTKYSINLANANLTRIGGGFGWTAEKDKNPERVRRSISMISASKIQQVLEVFTKLAKTHFHQTPTL